jgi:tetratricopeptide (TPR) repeat protein
LVCSGFDALTQPSRNITPPHLLTLSHDLTPSPFSAPLFLGREKEMKKIQDLLAGKNSIVLSINGSSGIGKSSLLSEYYRASGNAYKHCAWVYCGIKSNESVIDTLANSQGPNLLVIDNISDAKDLEEGIGVLSKLNNFHILFSSQSILSQSVVNMTLESVSKEDALQIFKKYYLKHQPFDDYLFFEIWTSISGNTQLLEFLAKNLNDTNNDRERYPLKKLCSDIQFKNTKEILAMFYSGGKFKKLTKAEKKLLSIFSVLPAEQIEYSLLERLGEFVEYFEASLFSLSQKGWIGCNPVQNSYRCSPLIQEVVFDKATNLYEDCEGLIDYLVEMFDTNPKFNTTWVRYGESLIKRLPVKNYNDGILSDRLGDYFESIGDYTKALTYYTIDLNLTKNLIIEYPLNEEFRNGLAISYEKIGHLYQDRLKDEKRAQNYFTLALQIWTNLVEEDPGNEEYASNLDSIQNELEKF